MIMTAEQRKTIEEQFYNYKASNEQWRSVFDSVLIRYKWKSEEALLRKKYIEHKNHKRICKEIGISKRTYSYWQNRILEDAYMFAKELKLL